MENYELIVVISNPLLLEMGEDPKDSGALEGQNQEVSWVQQDALDVLLVHVPDFVPQNNPIWTFAQFYDHHSIKILFIDLKRDDKVLRIFSSLSFVIFVEIHVSVSDLVHEGPFQHELRHDKGVYFLMVLSWIKLLLSGVLLVQLDQENTILLFNSIDQDIEVAIGTYHRLYACSPKLNIKIYFLFQLDVLENSILV